MAEKDQTEPKPRRHLYTSGIFLWPAVAIVLYCLSVGPAVKLADSRKLSPRAMSFCERIYVPIEWAYSKTFLKRPIGLYLHIWSKRWDSKGNEK